MCHDFHKGKSFTFSMHCKHNFPAHKEKSDWDIELQNGMKDEEYLRILSNSLDNLEQEHNGKVDFIFYQSGVDVMEGDRLGLLALSPQGVLKRDQMVAEFAERMSLHDSKFSSTHVKQRTIPMMSMMGGGYILNEKGNPVERVAQAHAQTVNVLRNHWILEENSYSGHIKRGSEIY